MSDLNLTSFNPLYPMRVHQYDELFNDQNQGVPDKINSIIDYLNKVGKLTNDVVKDWNTVYQWVMNDGLTTDVNNKLEAMLANGEFDVILNTVVTKIGDLTQLTTTQKDNLVNAINSLRSDLNTAIGLKANQSDLNTTNANVATNTANIATNTANIASNTTNITKNTSKLTNLTIDVKSDYGAKGDGVTNDTTSIQNAINACKNNGGGRIIFPQGTYLFDQLVMDNTTNSCITLEGVGSPILLANSSLTTDAIIIESSTATVAGQNFNRRIKLINLMIQGSLNWNSWTQANRTGLRLQAVQDIYLDNVWISNFSQYGLKLVDCYDSVFLNVQILRCGTANSTTSYQALYLTGNIDQSNANKFIGCHFELNALMLLVDKGSRHNHFYTCKFEHGGSSVNTSGNSPIAHADCSEIVYSGCQFVYNANQQSNLFFYSNSQNSASNDKAVIVDSCMFTCPTASSNTWIGGSFLQVSNCVFNDTWGNSPFVLRNNSLFMNNHVRIKVSSSIIFVLDGSNIRCANNIVEFLETTPIGSFMNHTSNALNTTFEFFTIIGNLPTNPYGGNTPVNMATNRVRNGITTQTFSQSANPTVTYGTSVYYASYSSAQSVSGIKYGYDGQEITIISLNGNMTLNHNDNTTTGAVMMLKSGANTVVSANTAIRLVNRNNIWYQV